SRGCRRLRDRRFLHFSDPDPAERARLTKARWSDSSAYQTAIRAATVRDRKRRNCARSSLAPEGTKQDRRIRERSGARCRRDRASRDQGRGRQSGILCMHTKTIGLVAHTGKRGGAGLIKSIAKEFESVSIS